MRELKKGSIGAAVLMLGYFNSEQFGGYYQEGEKRKKTDVGYGKFRVFGVDLPSVLLHHPLLEVMQLGATIRRVTDSKLRKSDRETRGIGEGVLAGLFGLTEEVPFAREMLELTKVFKPRERMDMLHKLAAGIVVPALSQQLAAWLDKDIHGQPIKRKPETFVQQIEAGIPGLRQNVPVKR